MSALTRQDMDNIKHVASLSDSWEEHELDFSDDRQWASLCDKSNAQAFPIRTIRST